MKASENSFRKVYFLLSPSRSIVSKADSLRPGSGIDKPGNLSRSDEAGSLSASSMMMLAAAWMLLDRLPPRPEGRPRQTYCQDS
jgi:hypothetical protein